MYLAVTNNIRVAVEPAYSPERSLPDEGLHFWLYTIEIVNLGRRTVQLTHRHWVITDASGKRQEVRGVGVIGEQPRLAPGQSFRYTSGCPLGEPSGMMQGAYRMVAEDGEEFEVTVPAFSLDIPSAPRVVN
jgi:ApaG protein